MTKTDIRRLIHIRTSFYWGMVGSGAFLIWFPPISAIEGIAFITAGVVGLIMSFVTGEIAQEIKDTITKDGDKTRKILGEMATSMDAMAATLTEIKEILKKK